MSNPFDVVEKFEQELCEYTGAPMAVAVASCTDALGLCFEYLKENLKDIDTIELPNKTYIGVAMQAKRAGWKIKFIDYVWNGLYIIHPIDVWDSARRFRSDMFPTHTVNKPIYMCVSFHASKILGYTHGGAILHNDIDFDKWALQARFDGRNPEWKPTVLGRHANMTPDVAAALRYKLYHLPKDNPDLPNSDYPDLSQMEIFK